MSLFYIQPFHTSHSNFSEIINFSKENVWRPAWSHEQITRFLTQLISTPSLIIDLHEQSSRVATAVLIDKIQNISNYACLEMLAVRPGFDIQEIYQEVISRAKHLLPEEKSGFAISIHESTILESDFFQRHHLHRYYEMFEMCNSDFSDKKYSVASEQISFLEENDFHECYQVLRLAFAQSPDVNLLPFEDWVRYQKNLDKNHFRWIYKQENRILGALHLVVDKNKNSGEIRSVAIIPDAQGKGLGKQMILWALRYLQQIGISHGHLSVAVQNNNALNLYSRIGFQISDHYTVYDWKRH